MFSFKAANSDESSSSGSTGSATRMGGREGRHDGADELNGARCACDRRRWHGRRDAGAPCGGRWRQQDSRLRAHRQRSANLPVANVQGNAKAHRVLPDLRGRRHGNGAEARRERAAKGERLHGERLAWASGTLGPGKNGLDTGDRAGTWAGFALKVEMTAGVTGDHGEPHASEHAHGDIASGDWAQLMPASTAIGEGESMGMGSSSAEAPALCTTARLADIRHASMAAIL
eukprot:CAMPEP_0204604714 /NCGR_PEP_ID=MMETSP0661-20131031/58040_1 /ASSEMBLY_ACC=CAM_ASM_000606 /TAXON_ID=109239 /ORGANISM="Alexandrium margalefi, Strain AMGDE01CS-322" /LENGTH=229 /DNA_ID=CAMNT_0051615897 /DNA_START=130 /DNA_END=821 /DNA_ORIENTATION=-